MLKLGNPDNPATASDCPAVVGGRQGADGSPEDRRPHAPGQDGQSDNQAGGEAGSGKGELPCKQEQQQQRQDAAPRHLPEEFHVGNGVCVMCKGWGADRLCKYCGWPLHRYPCAIPVRENLLVDCAQLLTRRVRRCAAGSGCMACMPWREPVGGIFCSPPAVRLERRRRRRVWIAYAGSTHRVASRCMLHVSCQIDVPCSVIATLRLTTQRDGAWFPVHVASTDPRVTSLSLTCTGQQLGAFTIACRLLCLHRDAQLARTARGLRVRSPVQRNGDGTPRCSGIHLSAKNGGHPPAQSWMRKGTARMGAGPSGAGSWRRKCRMMRANRLSCVRRWLPLRVR